MTIYPVFYKTSTTYVALTNLVYDTNTRLINEIIPPTPPLTATRSFDLPLGTITGKKGFGYRVGDMIVRGDGYITFYPDYILMSGPAPRLYVYDVNRTKKWKNVEIEVEYMRVAESNPPSYAGLGIGVRSIHETQTSNNLVVPTYYCKHTFDSRFFFEKEYKHGSTYTKQPDSQTNSYPMKASTWYKMRFKVRSNSAGDRVLLEAWFNDALIRSFIDTGNWDSTPIIKEGTSCFIRTDSVTDFRIRKFSIKEIA